MPGKPLRCRFGLHKWRPQQAPDGGGAFFECVRCQRVRSPDGPSVPPIVM
jgi:hypothetical protein